jgi:hypothetical protein
MEVFMNNTKNICMIVIALVTMYFQGCCSDCQKQVKINKELSEMAYAYVHSPQLDRLLKDLVQEAIKGNDYNIDKYIYVRKLIHNEHDQELFEDYDVDLLKGLGDVRFLKALKRQDGDSQDDVCGSLMRYQWHIDADEEEYNAAKERPEYDYPKTKVYVFELTYSWYKD